MKWSFGREGRDAAQECTGQSRCSANGLAKSVVREMICFWSMGLYMFDSGLYAH
jgi:hypothetical protein